MPRLLRPVVAPRQQLIAATATLFRRQGYAATGINEVVALSGAPKGSLYHYFPEGKEQLGEEAVRYSGALGVRTLAELQRKHGDPSIVLLKYSELLKQWMAKSDWTDGCPIGTVISEIAPHSDRIAAAGAECFNGWADVFYNSLVQRGVSTRRAKLLGSFVVSAFEGALIQCKAARSSLALDEATTLLAELFKDALVQLKSARG